MIAVSKLKAQAWDMVAKPKTIPPQMYNLIADNEQILSKILNISQKELQTVLRTYQDPAQVEQILRALTQRGFIITDRNTEDLARFKQNIGTAFEIGLQGGTTAPGGVTSIIQTTMVDSVMNYVTRMDTSLKQELGQILAEGYIQKRMPVDTVRLMSERVGISKARAGMIARTETMRSSNIANWTQAKTGGAKYFIVDHRAGACKHCIKLFSSKIFRIDETRFIPPIHPNCACVPIFFHSKAEARDYLDRVLMRNIQERKLLTEQGFKLPSDGTGVNALGREQQEKAMGVNKLIDRLRRPTPTTPTKSKPATNTKPYPNITDKQRKQINKMAPQYTEETRLKSLKAWNRYPDRVKNAAIDNDLWVVKHPKNQNYTFYDRTGKTNIDWNPRAYSDMMKRYDVELTDLLKEYTKTPLALRKSTTKISIMHGRSGDGYLGMAYPRTNEVKILTNSGSLFRNGVGAKVDYSFRTVLNHEMSHTLDFTLKKGIDGVVSGHKYFSSLVDEKYFKAVQKDISHLKSNFNGETIKLDWGNGNRFIIKPDITDHIPATFRTADSRVLSKYAVSDYGSTSMDRSFLTENWAEGLSFSLNNPVQFKKYFPNQYKVFQDVLIDNYGMVPNIAVRF